MSIPKIKSPEINHKKLKLEYEFKKRFLIHKGMDINPISSYFSSKVNNQLKFFKLLRPEETGMEMIDLSNSNLKKKAEELLKEPKINRDFKVS